MTHNPKYVKPNREHSRAAAESSENTLPARRGDAFARRDLRASERLQANASPLHPDATPLKGLCNSPGEHDVGQDGILPCNPLPRWILHLDLDAFFASVEELLNPDLRGKPIIVGGSPEHRGVVSSASYPARKFGVRSAMPTGRALRLCPDAILVTPRHNLYGKYSDRVMDILREHSPLVEQVSIDEAFVDLTGCERLWGPIPDLARRLQQRVQDEVELSASVGLASCKLVAKIASDLRKPHGLVVVEHGTEAEFLAPLPVERLWGVGKVTAASLHRLGVETIGDLQSLPETALTEAFGPHGGGLRNRALGHDDSPVITEWEAKSVSNEETFSKDIADEEILKKELLRLSDKVASRLRANGQWGRTVRLKLRYHDFSTILRSETLPEPTQGVREIHGTILQLWAKHWQRGRPVRLVGVGVANLESEPARQLGLFDQEPHRDEKLDRALDEIREKFGRDAIKRASLVRGERRTSLDEAE